MDYNFLLNCLFFTKRLIFTWHVEIYNNIYSNVNLDLTFFRTLCIHVLKNFH